MDNLVLLPKTVEIEQLSKQLGFSHTLFLGTDFVLLTDQNQKEALKKIQQAKQRKLLTIYQPASEELLRFALEKTPVDMVVGAERINPHDSLHYPRSGLDQVLCTIAAERGKRMAVSFADILNHPFRARLLSRIIFNVRLYQKYKVRPFFSTFAQEKWEMRSAHDLLALWRVLGGKGKDELSL